ncbi:hypothetical protein BDC45DRAFT_532629 [Circinella umbellata]|nr:hypothetical protein BDC45DRAFT_532629 [Circinella umbellata]
MHLQSEQNLEVELLAVLLVLARRIIVPGSENSTSGSPNAKLIVEGKVILDKIAQTCQMKFEDAKKITSLKAVLVQVSYAADGEGYITQTLGKTINFPIAQKSIGDFIQEMAEKNLRILQDGLNQDRDSFSEDSFKQDLSYIKPTWLGPKTGSKIVMGTPETTPKRIIDDSDFA